MLSFMGKLQSGYYSENNYEYITAKEAKSDPAKAAQKERYNADLCRRHSEFKHDALEELGITNHPKADKLFELAWSEGHSSGYHEVWNIMITWAELIRE